MLFSLYGKVPFDYLINTNMTNDIPPLVKERIKFTAEYIGGATTDWLLVKRQLINCLPQQFRGLFSVRHQSTRKHTLSEFDQSVIAYWKQLTGIKLILAESMRHDPNWTWKPTGWALNGGREKHEQAQKAKKNPKTHG